MDRSKSLYLQLSVVLRTPNFSTQCVRVFDVSLRKHSDYYAKQHWAVDSEIGKQCVYFQKELNSILLRELSREKG
jgi:hypothetical protein